MATEVVRPTRAPTPAARIVGAGLALLVLLTVIVVADSAETTAFWMIIQLCYLPILTAALFYSVRGGLLFGVVAGIAMLAITGDTRLLTVLNASLFVIAGVVAGSAKGIHQRHLDIERAATDYAVTLVELRDTLLASVSHEMRNSLTGIIGLSDTLLDQLDALADHEVREFITLISEESKDLAILVEDLLVSARVDRGDINLIMEEVELGDIAADVIGVMQPQEVILGLSDSRMAWGDRTRIRQVLRNLLTNARRYGGPPIKVTTGQTANTIWVRVIDNGPGVPEHDIEKIFDPFQRATDGTMAAGSVGLGLAVSRKLAEAMGGSLEYRRADDQTTFELSLTAAGVRRRAEP